MALFFLALCARISRQLGRNAGGTDLRSPRGGDRRCASRPTVGSRHHRCKSVARGLWCGGRLDSHAPLSADPSSRFLDSDVECPSISVSLSLALSHCQNIPLRHRLTLQRLLLCSTFAARKHHTRICAHACSLIELASLNASLTTRKTWPTFQWHSPPPRVRP